MLRGAKCIVEYRQEFKFQLVTCDNIFIKQEVDGGSPKLALKVGVDRHHDVGNLDLLRLDEPAIFGFNLQYLVLFGLIFDLSFNFEPDASLISWMSISCLFFILSFKF